MLNGSSSVTILLDSLRGMEYGVWRKPYENRIAAGIFTCHNPNRALAQSSRF
jgi:hypothetical protein